MVFTPKVPPKAIDFQEPYLRTLLGFIGLSNVTFIHAEKLAFGLDARAAALAVAKAGRLPSAAAA